MTSDFTQRIQELIALVGPGDLTGHVVVDQVYAHRQHEDLAYKHPRGGHAKYLETPLLDNRETYLELIAETVLEDGGKRGMVEAMEDLSERVAEEAPVLWGDLRESGHPFVDEAGVLVYDRPPRARRLTEAELRAKARLLPIPGPLLGYIYWHVEHRTSPPGRR